MIITPGEIEIIDAQVHLNQLGPDWQTAPIDSVIATGIEAMDAVGIDRVLIGEAHGFDSQFRPLGEVLPNGAVRTPIPSVNARSSCTPPAPPIMWASDYTVARDQNANSWAQYLYYLLDSDQLSRTEKEWLFGGSARRVLNRTD